MNFSLKKALKYLFFILLINLVFFLALEGILRLVPLLPEPGYFKEFKDQQGRVWVKYKPGVNKPRFLKQKPEGTFRIFAFGGSTIMGSPFYGRSSFPKMLEYALKKAYPEREIEVINLGASGMNSLEVKFCLLQSLKYEPDLVLIYSGQNELYVASLIPDYKHPILDRILDQLRLHSRLYQLFRSFNLLGTNQKGGENPRADFKVPAPENQPVSEEFRKERILSYQHHLERMLSVLKRKKLPALLCTLTVNLKDWPPEWLPYPEKLSEKETKLLIQNLSLAYSAIFEGRLKDAERFLAQAESLAPDYPMSHFLAGWLEEKRGDFSSAQKHFLLARKLDKSRHRAPPEINQIIRQTAQKYPVVLVDIENLFFQQAKTTPGFDLFVDHCHPTLFGQWLIAREIFQKILQAGFLPQRNFSFPSLEEIIREFKIDEDYLAQVRFYLAIYYLLQRRLPEFDAQTRKFLQEVIALQPDNLLARFCLIALYLELGWEEQAHQFLLQTLKIADNNQMEMMLRRYFFPKILKQGNYFLFSLNLAPTSAPLSGIILIPLHPEASWQKPILPLEDYQWIFYYQEASLELKDLSQEIHQLAQNHQKLCSEKSPTSLELLPILKKSSSFPSQQLKMNFSEKVVELSLLDRDAFLIFPLQITPFKADKLNIEIKAELEGEKTSWLEIYWSQSPSPSFSEADKLLLSYPADGSFHQITLDLAQILPWLSTPKIYYLRIDPATSLGRVWIKDFYLTICSP